MSMYIHGHVTKISLKGPSFFTMNIQIDVIHMHTLWMAQILEMFDIVRIVVVYVSDILFM